MNLTILVLVILSFVCLDKFLVPAIVGQRVALSADYRIPVKFGFGELRAFIDRINQDPRPKIIMTGDSVIQGGGVGSASETISFFLQQALQTAGSPYQVYNLGLSGATPADVFFVLKSLRMTDGDIVVYDFNIGHYGKGKKAITYPTITAQLAQKEHRGQSLHSWLPSETDRLEERLQLIVTNHWKLYAYRDVIKSVYRERLFGVAPETSEVRLEPWYADDWTDKTKNLVKRGAVEIAADDVNLLFTRYLIQAARDQGARVLMFNIPLNQRMMDMYEMIDRTRYNQNVILMRRIMEKEGAVFVDYEQIVPSDWFTDSVHPMKEGNRMIAEQLRRDLQKWLITGDVQ